VYPVKFPSLLRPMRDRLLAPLVHPDQAERLLAETFRTLSLHPAGGHGQSSA
jgi:hypothetical protein